MKRIIPALLITVCSMQASAIPIHKTANGPVQQQHQAQYQQILQKQAATLAAAKTTAVPKRLIASSYVKNSELSDSNHYYYHSDVRGSAHTDPNSYYDEYVAGAANPIQTIMCDTSLRWYNTGGTLTQGTGKAYIYDANNRVAQFTYFSPWYTYKDSCYYDATGKMIRLTAFDQSGSSFNAVSRSYISYNANGKRTIDSTVNIQSGLVTAKRLFTYNANGDRLTTSFSYGNPLELRQRTTNTYDANNRLITTISESDLGSGLENNAKDSFGYTGSSALPSYHMSSFWDVALSSWTDYEALFNHYNAQNLLDTYYLWRYDAPQWDTIERDVYTYDTDNLLLHSNGYLYTGSGSFDSEPYDQSTMYYEEYYPTSIASKDITDNTFSIYPNPAKNLITIRTTSPQTGDITVFDAGGKLISKREETQLNTQIDISNYMPGTYSILISKDGLPAYRATFLKL